MASIEYQPYHSVLTAAPSPPLPHRYLVVTSQYRTPLNFTPEVLSGARNTVRRLDKVLAALRAAAAAGTDGQSRREV